jgi:ABC-type sugar transport system substrate-binding protein
MRKIFFAVTTAACLTIGMLSGCGSNPSSGSDSASASGISAETSSGSAAGKQKIAVVLNTLSSEYWGYVKAGAEDYGKEHPEIEVSVRGGTSETAYDEQQSIVETLLASGEYDGMVVSPLQQETIAKLVANVDIPVIAVNTDLESGKKLSFVGTGNEDAAAQGGKASVEKARELGWKELNCILIQGVQGDPTMEARATGFQKGVEEAGGTFLANEKQYADSVADKAVTAMEAVIQTHPEGIACILCCNDDMAIAAARVAADYEAYANTVFCGFDGIQTACQSILEGNGETMSVAQDPYGMGYQSVEACVNAINGATLEKFIDTGCSIITADNAQEQMDTLKSYLGE